MQVALGANRWFGIRTNSLADQHIQLKGQAGQTSVDGNYAVQISHIEEVTATLVTQVTSWWWWRLMPALRSTESSCGGPFSARNQFGESVADDNRLSAVDNARRCKRKPIRRWRAARSPLATRGLRRAVYRSELADAITSEISVIDGTLTLDATNIIEATRQGERRKFLTNRTLWER